MSRQTKSFLINRFREMGITPATRHGQNFLIDLNLQAMIVDAAQLDLRDVVLEVGTGTGSLTAQFASQAAAVISVEIDGHLFEMASELLLDHDNVTLLRFDALHNKNRLAPQLIEAIGQQLAVAPDRRFKLVANLPYNIATPILSNLLNFRKVGQFDDHRFQRRTRIRNPARADVAQNKPRWPRIRSQPVDRR